MEDKARASYTKNGGWLKDAIGNPVMEVARRRRQGSSMESPRIKNSRDLRGSYHTQVWQHDGLNMETISDGHVQRRDARGGSHY
ncbi:hypothetical protein SLA2020_189530 [Shorea laevis]